MMAWLAGANRGQRAAALWQRTVDAGRAQTQAGQQIKQETRENQEKPGRPGLDLAAHMAATTGLVQNQGL